MSDEVKSFIAVGVTFVLFALIVASCTVGETRERTKMFAACVESGASAETCILMSREAR